MTAIEAFKFCVLIIIKFIILPFTSFWLSLRCCFVPWWLEILRIGKIVGKSESSVSDIVLWTLIVKLNFSSLAVLVCVRLNLFATALNDCCPAREMFWTTLNLCEV